MSTWYLQQAARLRIAEERSRPTMAPRRRVAAHRRRRTILRGRH